MYIKQLVAESKQSSNFVNIIIEAKEVNLP